MMAASARTSGTRAPAASSLNWGSCASLSCRAAAAARARATFARRAREALAEYAAFFFVAAFLSVSFLLEVEPVCANADGVGQANAAITVRRQISREILNGRVRVTGETFEIRVLKVVSAFYQRNCSPQGVLTESG